MNASLPQSMDSSQGQARVPAAPRRPFLEFLRYFVASGGALAVDFGLYRLACMSASPLAGGADRILRRRRVRLCRQRLLGVRDRSVSRAGVEFGLFVAIGIAGLLLTEAILWLEIERLGLPPLWSKVGAAGIVFFFNFGVRKFNCFSVPTCGFPGGP